MRSIDIIVDRAGFYETWGCLVWVPSVYTLHTRLLVETPSDLSWEVRLLDDIPWQQFRERHIYTGLLAYRKLLSFSSSVLLALASTFGRTSSARRSVSSTASAWSGARHRST
eukprot:COSAG02_NODE_1772_length_10984_cov_8.166651_5_plen_112_part_00